MQYFVVNQIWFLYREQIFGYVKPLLKFYFCSSTLDTYIEFNYESEIDSEKYDGLKVSQIK